MSQFDSGRAEDAWIAFRHHNAGCGKAHFGESILDDGFHASPALDRHRRDRGAGSMAPPRRRYTIECEAKNHNVKAALNAHWPG